MLERVAIRRAVVLAAGTGSRLAEAGDARPKPLRAVAGVPLLVRVLRTLESVGIQEAVIITGYHGDQVRKALASEPSLGLRQIFVSNEQYQKKNGVSLLAAAGFIDRECILTMADHLYSPELVRRLMAAEVPEGCCALAVDSDIERCFDLDDATKVQSRGGRIIQIGKELETYDTLDTGVFRIGPDLLRELALIEARSGDCSLSDGVQSLARRGRFLAVNVGDVRWIDVDTPLALQRAEAMIRVFGDCLGDAPTTAQIPATEPEMLELFAPTWVRAASPYREDHFELADRNPELVRLMSNESPYAPSARVVAAVVDAITRGNHYPSGSRKLCQKLAERENFEPNQVLLGSGSTELIDVVVRTFVSPGEEVLLSVPTFSMYEARIRVVGGLPVLVPMRDESEHDLAQLVGSVSERTKLIFLCTPNNPTGNRLPEDALRRVLALGIPTVIDEAYFELGNGESYARMISEFPNAIVLRTFSKAFGLAGIRLGYLFARSAVVALFERVKVPWSISSLTLAAANAALDDTAEFEANLRELRESRARLVEGLSLIRGIVAIPSEGNFVLADISALGVSAERFVADVQSEGFLLRSLAVHHANKCFVRVTVGTPEQNAKCLLAIERVVRRATVPVAPQFGTWASIGDAE